MIHRNPWGIIDGAVLYNFYDSNHDGKLSRSEVADAMVVACGQALPQTQVEQVPILILSNTVQKVQIFSGRRCSMGIFFSHWSPVEDMRCLRFLHHLSQPNFIAIPFVECFSFLHFLPF